MLATRPPVTILMPVYNAEAHLAGAIESILNQTFKEFDFLIIDDGSTDATKEILKRYQDQDNRIRVVSHVDNKGVTARLNEGLRLIKSEYVARMDSDDISLPTRLQKQFNLMEKNPGIGVCGTWVHIFTQIPKIGLRYAPDLASGQIEVNFLFENAIQHPSVMMRRSILGKSPYPKQWPHIEDYALWASLISKTSFYILPEVLLHYRLHGSQIGKIYAATQTESVAKLHEQLLERLGSKPNAEELRLHKEICLGSYKREMTMIGLIEQWLLKLVDANKKNKFFPSADFATVIGKKWFAVCVSSSNLGLPIWEKYWSSPLSKKGHVSYAEKRYFLLETRFFPFLRPAVKRLKTLPVVRKILRG